MISRNLRLTMRHKLRFAEANAGVAMPVNCGQSNVYARSKQNLIKKSMLLVALFIFTSVVLKAQSPQKINFQSIVRNTSGVIVSNKSVKFKITILSDSTTGSPVYSETHLKTTDAIGLVSLQIGTGTVSSGIFSSLNWGNASHFIKLEADFTGGNTYVTLGTQELMSVPYAMYASKTDTASLNLTNRFAEKAPINNPEFTGTVYGIDKNMIGLGNVDNTSDANKPVSSATQTALNDKAPINSPTFTGTVGGITKAMVVGLENVENTSDVNKPVSSATQTALNDKAPINSPTFTGTVGGVTQAMVGLGNVDNTSDVNKPVSSATQTALATKVNILDTSSMLSKYLRKADFPSGSSANQILYWDGSKWVSLSPGTTGQALIMSSTGLSWGCIITNAAGTPSSNPTLLVNTTLTDITIATTRATGIDTTGSGLPNGVTATWSANVITISGIPTYTGTFNYTIPLTGGCGTASATGTITAIACPAPTVEDIDGNIYNTVSIGNQCWTKENLRVSRYKDGTLIPIVTDSTTWVSLITGGRSWYDNDSTANEIPYGNLYNWYAVNDSLKLCPDGWHVPTDAEWTILTTYLGGESVAGAKMKSTDTNYWNSVPLGTDNSSSFSALGGGFRTAVSSFVNVRGIAWFWSATEKDLSTGWFRLLASGNFSVTRLNGGKSTGASVRCLRD